MAGMRNINSGTRRAALQWYGLVPNAGSVIEKTPDLCNNDFLQTINSAGTGLVPLLGHGSATLVSTTKKQLLSIPLTALTAMGGFVRATVIASDATDVQAFTELIELAAVNKAGSYTKTVTNLSTVGAKAVSAGTLTTSWALDDGTNAVILAVTATTSLTATSLVVHFDFGMSHTPAGGVQPTFL